jgi:hypothetical protein
MPSSNKKEVKSVQSKKSETPKETINEVSKKPQLKGKKSVKDESSKDVSSKTESSESVKDDSVKDDSSESVEVDKSVSVEAGKVVSKKAAPKKAAASAAADAKSKPSKPSKKDNVLKGSDSTETNDKKQRSFKVKLPGSNDFTGRFTGLTPYQAGNKALSKYFRTNKTVKPNKTITIEIQESTRNSKKGTYTYEGSRIKLEIPVEYIIKDGDNERTIVKEFKNKLIKKKKTAEVSA